MAKNKYYITTAIPYVNAKPHVGHALEYVVADAIHRYQELAGKEVFFVSGADENAIKNVQAAEKEGLPPAEFLDKYSKIWRDFYKLLDASLDEFRRGTDEKLHWPGVQKLWKLAEKKGDIYKKKYKGLYCTGCESFKTAKELVNGKCPDHDRIPEEVEEENYFFKLSNYQKFLHELFSEEKLKIYPEKRKNEVLSFIDSGLEDFSISRSNERARNIGVPVPGDKSQKMYVWFDALTIYMTAVGWGHNESLWKKWWPADLHVIGKDIIRFHAVYWPAMLESAGLPLPKELLVHGFITSGGRKMSKTIGNVVDPYKIIEKYKVEALRYYLLSQIPTQDDGDFTEERFREVYQADLANGIGNLVSRVSKLLELKGIKTDQLDLKAIDNFSPEVSGAIESYQIQVALAFITECVSRLDKYLNEKEPWKKTSLNEKILWTNVVNGINQIAFDLKPFLPETAEKIKDRFKGPKIKSGEALFPRLK